VPDGVDASDGPWGEWSSVEKGDVDPASLDDGADLVGGCAAAGPAPALPWAALLAVGAVFALARRRRG
jgi:MYXO-CTERM domain-containing protein